MKYCRNKILDREIHRHESSVNYWKRMKQLSGKSIDGELAEQQLAMYEGAVRRLQKIKNK